jgi:capsular exopolysaccharide synthesis family protein
MSGALNDATRRRIAAEQKLRQAAPGTAAQVNERTAGHRSQLAALQAEFQEKSSVFQPDYPDMVRLRSRIQSVEQAIQNETAAVRSSQTTSLQADYQAIVAEERALAAQVVQLRRAALDLRGRSIQYNILQRDVDTNSALYDALLQRYKEIGVAGGIGTSHASIVDRGQVPGSPYKPNLMINLLIGLALGLFSGVGVALLLEFLNDTIKSPDDVREKLQLAFLGGIPAAKGVKVVDELRDAGAGVSEAYFSAMTSLQFTTEAGAPKVLVVTSTRAAEGKSTTAWALATSFARVGRSVLLIDADMRKPAFVTGAEKKDGLATLLTNRDLLKEHIVKPEAEGVWLLPCGPLPPNPAELLSSTRFEALLAEAVAQFDMVVIDSPPILGLADTPLLASRAAGTLMVIEAGKTRTRAASEALGRLRQSGATVVGAVLTRYKHDTAGYGYGYEAYRYSSVQGREREIRLIVGKDG